MEFFVKVVFWLYGFAFAVHTFGLAANIFPFTQKRTQAVAVFTLIYSGAMSLWAASLVWL